MRNPLSVALFTLMLSPLAAFAQQQFATPEQAATALAEAISQPNEAALSEVLGDNWQQFLPTDRIDPAAVDRFQRDWQVKHVIIQQGDKAWLDVGSEAWRLPVPIVKASEDGALIWPLAKRRSSPAPSAAMSCRRSPPCMPMLMPSRIIII